MTNELDPRLQQRLDEIEQTISYIKVKWFLLGVAATWVGFFVGAVVWAIR